MVMVFAKGSDGAVMNPLGRNMMAKIITDEALGRQGQLPFLTSGTEIINQKLAVYRGKGELVFYAASGPIHTCSENDPYSIRLAQGMLINLNLITITDLAKVLGMHEIPSPAMPAPIKTTARPG
jgi:hypothetical protein